MQGLLHTSAVVSRPLLRGRSRTLHEMGVFMSSTTEQASWQANIIRDPRAALKIAGEAKRVAVLGIAPEQKADRPAHYVAASLQATGVEVVPVPVYYPDVHAILGQKVYRKLADIPGPVDIVDVFRRAEDLAPHLEDILSIKPKVVWLQSGISDQDFEEQVAKAGIQIVPDRCLKVDRERALSRL